MALHRRLDCESSVYEVRNMLQVPKSARGKRSMRKKVEDSEMSAFDLLVAVAGNLLSEQECSMDVHYRAAERVNPPALMDTVKEAQLSQEKSSRSESFDKHSCHVNVPGTEIIPEKKVSRDMKERQLVSKAAVSGSDSDFLKPNSIAVANDSSLLNIKCETGHNAAAVTTEKWDSSNNSPRSTESYESKGNWIKEPLQIEQRMTGDFSDLNKTNICCPEDPMDLDTKPPAWLCSGSSAEAPFYRNDDEHTNSIRKSEDGMKIDVKDDEERSSACTNSSTLRYKDSKLQKIGDRKIRKLLSSKYSKAAPKMLQDEEFSNYNAIRGKKMCYTRQRTNRTPFKRRKLFENSSLSTSDERIQGEGFLNTCKRGSLKVEGNSTDAHRGNGASSATSEQKLPIESQDCRVKLSIKSFKVPELYVEIPETATVASLKKTVMEAVTAILGDGVHVGLLLQGKKVRDDKKTLLQAGILHGDKLDNLGFTLEPNTTLAPQPPTNSEDLDNADIPEPLARILPVGSPTADQVVTDSSSQLILASCPESDDSSHTPPESMPEKIKSSSRALVAVPSSNAESLAMVPSRKFKRSEVVQRRIRRPFTVAEVEALVQAVEKLGTGRWRDVKLRAFDNAKHRTYVDLKDKWKTLVHTARISPQQRRGEPVPQDLLDRVLAAHGYWSQQQAKLQVKSSPQAETCLSSNSKNNLLALAFYSSTLQNE